MPDQRVAVDASRSFIERAVSFEKNVEIEASQTFTPTPTPGALPLRNQTPASSRRPAESPK